MLTVEDIQRATCEHFSVSMAELVSPRRPRSIILPRQVAMYLCRRWLDVSYAELGERFGGRDHTTVMSAVNRIAHRLKDDDADMAVRVIGDGLDRTSEPEPEKGKTIMSVRVDGVLCYAVGLSKADAEWLKRLVGQWRSGMSAGGGGGTRVRRIVKSLDWVIETAERDEQWARERAAGEVPDV